MIRLLMLSLKNQFLSQLKKPLEFLSAVVVIMLNNSFYLYGIYLLTIFQFQDHHEAAIEYLVSTGIVLIAWGIMNVIAGGLFQIGTFIETGELDTYLARPRNPLFLMAISKSTLISMAEIIQGLITVCFVGLIGEYSLVIRSILCSLVVAVAFASILIFIGTFSFFSSKGGQLSNVIIQVVLSLSLFPVARSLRGNELWILYLTPLVMTATLPRLFANEGNVLIFLSLIVLSSVAILASILFFNFGLKRYKAKNYVHIND